MEEEREKERLKKRLSSDTSMSYYTRSNSVMYDTPEPSYDLPGPFKHMLNPYADVEDLHSRPVSRGGWATHLSQLPPLRGTPREPEPSRPASRGNQSPRRGSRVTFLSKHNGLESSKPPPYTGRESPRETDIRPKTAISRRKSCRESRRDSRPATSVFRPRNFPPQLPAGGAFPLYYVDISPSGLRASMDMSASVRYDRFDVLVGKANAWLAANPEVLVINCETIETRSDDEDAPVDTAMSSSYDDGEQPMYYHRSLRIWIRTRTKSDPPGPQSINFMNIVPQCFNPEGFNYMESPEFETLSVALSKFNTTLSNAPLKGKVINIETVNVKFIWGKDMPDLDKCQWEEDGQRSTYSIASLRVFYQDKIRLAKETVGIMDFVPNQVRPAIGLTSAVHETVDRTMNKVNDWLMTQEDISVVNLQTVEYTSEAAWIPSLLYCSHVGRCLGSVLGQPFHSIFNSQAVHISYHSIGHLRFVRVYFTREPYNTEIITDLSGECKLPPCFSYQTFQPEQIQNTFESQKKTLQQAMSWVKMTDARVACCETVQVRMEDDGTGDPEVTLAQNSNTGDQHIKYVHRVFLDGIYKNPVQPKEFLNKATKSRSCTIL